MESIDEKATAWLDGYARALTAGDLAAIADSYVLPALVVADDGVVAVSERSDIETAFRGAGEQYRARGLADTQPAILAVEPLTERLAWVDVLWVLRDFEGRTAGHERMGYLLRFEAGSAGIQVVVPRPVPEPLPTA